MCWVQCVVLHSSLGWFIWTQHIIQLTVGLLVGSVGRALYRYRRVQILYGPKFFSGPIFNYSFPSVVLLAARIS